MYYTTFFCAKGVYATSWLSLSSFRIYKAKPSSTHYFKNFSLTLLRTYTSFVKYIPYVFYKRHLGVTYTTSDAGLKRGSRSSNGFWLLQNVRAEDGFIPWASVWNVQDNLWLVIFEDKKKRRRECETRKYSLAKWFNSGNLNERNLALSVGNYINEFFTSHSATDF